MSRENDLSITTILKRVAILFVIAIVLALFHPQRIPLILGIVFGLTLSLLNFRLLYLALSKAVKMQEKRASAYTSSQYMLRYIITGISLYVSIKAPYINVIGTIVGLLILKASIYLSNMLNTNKIV